MSAVTAVLKDLYLFAFRYHFGFSDGSTALTEESPKALEAPFSPLLLTETNDTKATITASYPSESIYGDVGYALLPDTFLYALPTRTFDGVVSRLAYGATFNIINTQGKWVQVEYKNVTGWIHEDSVTKNKNKITPQFTYEKSYDADSESTLLLRAVIDDSFHSAGLARMLQDVEYVTYRLLERGLTIAWPPVRPRIAGTWQRILKGVRGVHMGIHPKTGSVMEYINADNTGHVAFVESVYPDESITVSEIGYPEEGVFHERTITKEEWIELRPIFIEIA